MITGLNCNCSPGIDGITSEHLKFGHTNKLCSVLAHFFSVIMSMHVVPTSFHSGVIIPTIKKPELSTNSNENYHPVTLSTTFSEMLELLMIPGDSINDTQFGLVILSMILSGGTSLACSLFNYLCMYCKYKHTPLYCCSLDADKYFDSIWHRGLFYKLYGKILIVI